MTRQPVSFSNSDLEDMALELGATIESATGSVFNASGRKGTRLPSRPPEPVAEPLHKILAQLVEIAARPAPDTLPVLPAPAAIAPWSGTFEFIRNPDGTLARIKAVPTPPGA